jgi:hypothetical protein
MNIEVGAMDVATMHNSLLAYSFDHLVIVPRPSLQVWNINECSQNLIPMKISQVSSSSAKCKLSHEFYVVV